MKFWKLASTAIALVLSSNVDAAILSFNFNDTGGEVGSFLLDTSYIDTNTDPNTGLYLKDAISNFSYRGGVVTGLYTSFNDPSSTLSLGFDNGPWSTNMDFWFFPSGVDLVNQLSANPGNYLSTGGHIYIDGVGTVDFENVSITAVPVPAAIWLFGSGLIGLISFSKRKKA